VDRPAPPPSAEGVYNKRVRKGPVKRVAKRGHGASAPRGANPLHKSSEPAGKTRQIAVGLGNSSENAAQAAMSGIAQGGRKQPNQMDYK